MDNLAIIIQIAQASNLQYTGKNWFYRTFATKFGIICNRKIIYLRQNVLSKFLLKKPTFSNYSKTFFYDGIEAVPACAHL